jgi:hypothetical protein
VIGFLGFPRGFDLVGTGGRFGLRPQSLELLQGPVVVAVATVDAALQAVEVVVGGPAAEAHRMVAWEGSLGFKLHLVMLVLNRVNTFWY